jgi:phosphoribosyl 1,2-cyclic phosphate phosphodiesterase
MKVTILGCGPSSGVPTVVGDWGACDPDNPRNRRRRPSILVEKDGTRILVDTSPDLRAQLLDSGARDIDAVLFTHDHADHVMGIDDLRGVRRYRKRNIDAWAAADVLARLTMKFAYIFSGYQDPTEMYRPILDPHVIEGPFRVGAFEEVVPVDQDHGICMTLGFRFGEFAYSTDVAKFPAGSLEALKGIDTWVVDCLRDGGGIHPTHANLQQTLEWIDYVRPRRAVLTHMNFQADYDAMLAACPEGVEPAYDGMVLEI